MPVEEDLARRHIIQKYMHVHLQESYGTQQAIALAQDLEKDSDAVLSTAIQEDGAISVSGVQISDKIVQVLLSSPNLRPAFHKVHSCCGVGCRCMKAITPQSRPQLASDMDLAEFSWHMQATKGFLHCSLHWAPWSGTSLEEYQLADTLSIFSIRYVCIAGSCGVQLPSRFARAHHVISFCKWNTCPCHKPVSR